MRGEHPGYAGRILRVNLTTGKTASEPTSKYSRGFVGGRGINARILFDEVHPDVGCFDPENLLIYGVGPLVGTLAPFACRISIETKNVFTGGYGSANCGGHFGAEMKYAGYDNVVITGRSPRPVYLWMEDGEAQLRDASHLWGATTWDAERSIREEHGDNEVRVSGIGLAGENLVRSACIMTDRAKAAGGSGVGAVMGSKNLKAVAVRGKNRPSVADKAGLNELARWGAANLQESDIAGLAKYGTAETTGSNQTSGTLPAYNFNSGVFDGWEAIDGTTMYDTVLRGAAEGKQDRAGRDTCYACTVRCKRVVEITEGKYKVDPLYGGPEYETTSTFGNYCAIDDLAAISKANEICNKYGMDSISCGATISWAFEAFNEGKLTLDDTDGLDLTWGNADAMVQLTERIAKREGFGDLLAEGSERAAKEIGRGTEQYLITFKGQEAPAHMPQVKSSLSIIYATNPFGADHQSHEHDPAIEGDFEFYEERMAVLGFREAQEPRSLSDEKIRWAMKSQHMYSTMDSLDLCQFVFGPAWQLYGPEDMLKLVQSVTGWEGLTFDELQEVGERRLNMMRAFNAREGIDRRADVLPEKLFKPLKGGVSDGWKLDREEVEAALDKYFEFCGWDIGTGIPTREKLDELDLGWIDLG